MLMLDVIINHFWQQIYGKRSNVVTVDLQVLNFVLGLFMHCIYCIINTC